MFLSANVQRALQAVLGMCQCVCRIASPMGVAVEHKVFFAQGLDHVQYRLQVFVFDDGGHGGGAGGVEVTRRYGQYWLPDELHRVDG